jgi:elongation factor P
MLPGSKLRKGMTILYEGKPHRVVQAAHQKTGRGGATIQSKLKNLEDGSYKEYRWRSDEKFEEARLDEIFMEYLYQDGENYCFMNSENYEQIMIHRENLGDAIDYLVPNTQVNVAFFENNPIGVILPPTVTLTITETGPNVKGNTAGNVTKPATLETGLVVQVPVFVETGEKIIVSTSDDTYESRAK